MPKKSASADTESKIIRTKESRMLKVNLTQEELLEAGQKMADAQQQLVELDNELQSFKDQIKGRVAEAEAVVSRCSSLVRQKYEHRSVPCDVTKDWNAHLVTVTRRDTMEIVENRAMTDNEMAMLPMEI